MHFQMWIQLIVDSVINAKGISTSTAFVLIITLGVHFIDADQHIDGLMANSNHTTNAVAAPIDKTEIESSPTKVLSRHTLTLTNDSIGAKSLGNQPKSRRKRFVFHHFMNGTSG